MRVAAPARAAFRDLDEPLGIIKDALQKIIDGEDKQKPLNDEALAGRLNEQGYPVARRTVAKYREQLKLPVARLRKEL